MDKIWLKHYLPSVPPVVDVDQYRSLPDLLKKSCDQFSNKAALTLLGFTMTYADLEVQSRYFAAFLQNALKIKKGDRLAIMLPNTFQFVIAFFAALRLGAVVVTVNPLDTPRELEYQLNDANVDSILVMDQFLGTVQAVLSNTKLKNIIVTDFADPFPLLKRFLIHLALKIEGYKKTLKKFLKGAEKPFERKGKIENAIQFRLALETGKNLHCSDAAIQPEDLALLQYTGGTTGVPKGAMLTHRNMVANVIQCITWVKPALKLGEERIVIALPLYHIFSLTVCCLSFLSIGGLGILVPDPRRIGNFIRVMKKEKPMVLAGVNTLFNALMNHPSFKNLDFSTLHLTISGGMKLQQVVADRWQEITGKVILEGYGLTEASPVVCVNPVNLKAFNGSVGFPIPSTEVSIRDDSGKEVSLKEVGELWVKGPQVMKGYLNQTQDTQAVLTSDGWLKTGDMAYIDEEGFVYLVDRKKELIIVSGFNVYPSEVEGVIASIPGIMEVAVVGVPDDMTGEAVKAFVVKKDPEVTCEKIIAYCKANLLPYKLPHQIEFIESLPKSPVGKVLKRALLSTSLRGATRRGNPE